MENPFSIGDYVDCKQIHADWFVGRIIEKEDDFVTIRLDGMAPNNDIVFLPIFLFSTYFIFSRLLNSTHQELLLSEDILKVLIKLIYLNI